MLGNLMARATVETGRHGWRREGAVTLDSVGVENIDNWLVEVRSLPLTSSKVCQELSFGRVLRGRNWGEVQLLRFALGAEVRRVLYRTVRRRRALAPSCLFTCRDWKSRAQSHETNAPWGLVEVEENVQLQ